MRMIKALASSCNFFSVAALRFPSPMRVPAIFSAFIIAAAVAVLPALGCTLNFQRTIDATLLNARNNHRLAILFFTGSDWNQRSIALHRSVLEQKEFSDWVNPRYSLLQVDYPQRFTLPDDEAAHNIRLAERFNIRQLPTIIAVTADGVEVGRMEYNDESAGTVQTTLEQWQSNFEASAPESLAAAAAKKSEQQNSP